MVGMAMNPYIPSMKSSTAVRDVIEPTTMAVT